MFIFPPEISVCTYSLLHTKSHESIQDNLLLLLLRIQHLQSTQSPIGAVVEKEGQEILDMQRIPGRRAKGAVRMQHGHQSQPPGSQENLQHSREYVRKIYELTDFYNKVIFFAPLHLLFLPGNVIHFASWALQIQIRNISEREVWQNK